MWGARRMRERLAATRDHVLNTVLSYLDAGYKKTNDISGGIHYVEYVEPWPRF
jgi:hypothetical protein